MITFSRSTARTAFGILAALGLMLSMFVIATPAMADAPGNNGTVKIHEGGSEEEPIVANDPHVCTFHLHFFFGDDVQSGNWWIEEWAPGDEKGSTVLSGNYDATNGEDRQPRETDVPNVYSLPDGHYKLFWEGATNPGGQLNIKHKVFWVDCGPDESPEESPMESPEESPEESPAESPMESPEESPAESPEESPMESPAESPDESPAESPMESPTESPEDSPRDGALGGNPRGSSGGGLPNTAMSAPAVPAWPVAVLFLGSLTGLLYLRLSTASNRMR